jgi:hypothetical protein
MPRRGQYLPGAGDREERMFVCKAEAEGKAVAVVTCM